MSDDKDNLRMGFLRILIAFLSALSIWLGFSLLVGFLAIGFPETLSVYTTGYLSMVGLIAVLGLAARSVPIKD